MAISPLDRGLAYGDGVFRTLAITQGRPRWWADHLEKLDGDCSRLDLPRPTSVDWESDLAMLGPLPGQGVLRLTVTRGEGPRGYRYPERGTGSRILACWEAESVTYPAEGLTLRVCSLRLAHQPALAGVKHLNRLENVLARAEWTDPDIHEGVLLDQAGHVVSGVMSNLFLWRAGRLLTPRVDRCGVAGVGRDRLLAQAAADGLRAQEAEFGLTELLDADEILLTNSLMGLRRVYRVGERTWPHPSISSRLAAFYEA
jgi:4-amino-4-deoxychorismate lyase